VLALAGAIAAVALFGTVHRTVGPVRTDVAIRPSWSGGTAVDVPPLGRLDFASHAGPLHVEVEVRSLDIADARRLVEGGTTSAQFEKEVTDDARRALVALIVRTALVALGGAVVVVLLVYRRGRLVLLAAATVLAALAVSGAITVGTWSTRAFTQPRFSGLLSSAPALIGNIDDIPDRFDNYRRQLAKLVSNVSKLYDVTSSLPSAISPDAIPVLWVSDIHDNPEAFTVMSSLVSQFDVKAVVDTGDLSDHGTAAENRLYSPIGQFDVPYVYVRGNHDSAATQSYVASLAGAHVLDRGRIETIAGLRFAGIGDPTFTPDRSVAQDGNQEILGSAGRSLAGAIDAATTPVDVALVHEPAMATPVTGHVPLVLSGHTHKRAHTVSHGTIGLTQGSSGGAGLRNLEGAEPLPLEMSVLYFDPTSHRLVAADDITVSGLGQESVAIQRHRASDYTGTDVTPTPSVPPSASTPSPASTS
jgi:predicted phosphodiesterase